VFTDADRDTRFGEGAVSWRPLLPRALRVPDGGVMVRCPLPDHDDAYASCQVFADAEQGWRCFGCSRGGRIYDLASLMAGGAWRRELAARRSGRYVSWWRRRSADAGCQRVGPGSRDLHGGAPEWAA
jgi:hypothetical protein